MSPMPEYSDEDLSPTIETKSLPNGCLSSNTTKISPIIEENGLIDNNESKKPDKVLSTNGTNNSDNQYILNAEVGVEITETDSIIEVCIDIHII